LSSYEGEIRSIAIIITAIVGFFFLIEYFIVWTPVNKTASNITAYGTVLLGLAGIVGIGNLTRFHLKNIFRQGKNWIPSIILLISLWLPLVLGLLYTRNHFIFSYIYNSIYLPTSQAFFAILAFYIVSGAYRAFKARNLDAAVLLIAGILVFMSNSPATGILWPGFQPLGKWIQDVFTAAGLRGITIGIAIGSVVTSLRVLTGRERRHLAGRGVE